MALAVVTREPDLALTIYGIDSDEPDLAPTTYGTDRGYYRTSFGAVLCYGDKSQWCALEDRGDVVDVIQGQEYSVGDDMSA